MNRWRWLVFLAGVIAMLLILKAFAFSVVEIQKAVFTYRPETELRGQRAPSRSEGVDAPLERWSTRGGQGPQTLRMQVTVKNYGNAVSPEKPVTVTYSAKVGELLVDQAAFMVDQRHLRQTARWEVLSTQTATLPVLAPGETFVFYTPALAFGETMRRMKDRSPVALKARIALGSSKATRTVEIPVEYGPFVGLP